MSCSRFGFNRGGVARAGAVRWCVLVLGGLATIAFATILPAQDVSALTMTELQQRAQQAVERQR
ncbi:MAG TPA: hypothetical protein VHF69_05825, partial [Candidatus Synoicihabitans sp.]|nr:hypothetical protein [Candidatus Synoicihabitans sp.]